MNENCCSVAWGRTILGGRAFALFLRPHHGAFGSLSAPTPGNLPSKKKNANARGASWGGGGAKAQLELTDA